MTIKLFSTSETQIFFFFLNYLLSFYSKTKMVEFNMKWQNKYYIAVAKK